MFSVFDIQMECRLIYMLLYDLRFIYQHVNCNKRHTFFYAVFYRQQGRQGEFSVNISQFPQSPQFFVLILEALRVECRISTPRLASIAE